MLFPVNYNGLKGCYTNNQQNDVNYFKPIVIFTCSLDDDLKQDIYTLISNSLSPVSKTDISNLLLTQFIIYKDCTFL